MPPLLHTPCRLDDVCVRPPLLVQRTVEPTLIVTLWGTKAKSTMLTPAAVGVGGGQGPPICVGVAVGVRVRVGVTVGVPVGGGGSPGDTGTTSNWLIMLASSCSSTWQWNTNRPR